MLDKDKTDKRKARHKVTQEDFTPVSIVCDMIAKLPPDTLTKPSKTVIDTSCGIGNFLVEILNRKLDNCVSLESGIIALKSVYGVELMADNVEECRSRLYQVFLSHFPQILEDYKLNFKIRAIIRNRIQWHDSLTFDYDNWPVLKTTPDKKHRHTCFKVRSNISTYPMWSEAKNNPKENMGQGIQLSLFDF